MPFEESRPSYGLVWAYLFWKCSVAVVFAFALYIMAIAGLIGGDLFPHFGATEQPAIWDIKGFVTRIHPVGYQDVAKTIFWSFIAGYSELFVPNLIGQVVNNAGKPNQGNT